MANNDDFIRLEWDGFDEFDELLEGLEKEFEEAVIDEYTNYGLLVEEGAKALAGKDRGELESSINFGKATKKFGNKIVVEGGSNLKYALRRHEEPYRMGVHDKHDNGTLFENYYVGGRGRKTLQKPSWRGYKPGRKFLQNAITATEKDYDKMNERILDRLTGGDGN